MDKDKGNVEKHEKTEEQQQGFSIEDVQDTDLFIGNLRPDVAPKVLIGRIQDLFLLESVQVKEGHFKCIHKGTKRPKHLFVRLDSVDDKMKVMERFDGYVDSNVTMDGKTLKVKSRLNKKLKASVTRNLENPITVLQASTAARPASPPVATSIIPGCVLENKAALTYDNDTVPRLPSPRAADGYQVGQMLQSEDRSTEYKSGTGSYLNKTLVRHVRKYICAFLNSEGGRLCVGVSDDCVVHGIPCTRKQEDTARVLIDNVIKRFHPPVFPDAYTVTFLPVYAVSSDSQAGEDDLDVPPLRVLEIQVRPAPNAASLYENDKGEVYIRRDGSIQGPLKASQIMEWCRLRYLNERPSVHGKKLHDGLSSLSLNLEESKSIASLLSNRSETLKDQIKRKAEQLYQKESELQQMERRVARQQHEVEQQLAALRKNGYQTDKSNSKRCQKKGEKKRPSSAVCILL